MDWSPHLQPTIGAACSLGIRKVPSNTNDRNGVPILRRRDAVATIDLAIRKQTGTNPAAGTANHAAATTPGFASVHETACRQIHARESNQTGTVRMYTVSQKKQDSKLLPITYPVLTDFQIVFAGRLNGKFATASDINIPPHLKYVAICEI